ncbi:uncharacterized protein LOC142557721 isoform X1 [Dermacentor variabilis]|uniref:uncharacterized protein LOC142557721 isoform X1 n=1 Tax=Dermacentor variabilis TaxID=34621 RepID=UPI003F5C486F
MKSYAILALVILGNLCQIRAATLSKPARNVDEATKELTERISRSLVEHHEDIIGAFKTLEKSVDSFGDETDEHALPAVAAAVAGAVASGAISAAVGALIQKLISEC